MNASGNEIRADTAEKKALVLSIYFCITGNVKGELAAQSVIQGPILPWVDFNSSNVERMSFVGQKGDALHAFIYIALRQPARMVVWMQSDS